MSETACTSRLAALRDCIRVYDGALESEFCAQLVRSFEDMRTEQARNGRGRMPALAHSAWTELNVSRVADAGFKGFFLHQIDRYLAKYNEDLSLTLPIPGSVRVEDLRIKRYSVESEDRFQPHWDSLNETSNRYLVFIWYLNDVLDGGETEFCDLGIKVEARAGRLLVFPPYWMFQHAGLPPRSNDKYMISTYLLF